MKKNPEPREPGIRCSRFHTADHPVLGAARRVRRMNDISTIKIDIKIDPPPHADVILKARTEAECDVAFSYLFDLTQRENTARRLLQWLYLPHVAMQVYIELLISTLRLTYTNRRFFEDDWKALFQAVHFEVVNLGLDPDNLLSGLSDP